MNAFGVVVLLVLALGIVVGVLLMRGPTPYDEIGGGGLDDLAGARPSSAPPSRADDEAELRALLARKRAARREREGLPPEEDPPRPLAQGRRGRTWNPSSWRRPGRSWPVGASAWRARASRTWTSMRSSAASSAHRTCRPCATQAKKNTTPKIA